MTSHTERELDRAAHPAPCSTDRNGQRVYTPNPDPAAIVRNFGHPNPAPADPPRPS